HVTSATVNGVTLPGGRNRAFAGGLWQWGFGYAAPPSGGVELTIRVRGNGPLPLRVIMQKAGLPDGVGGPQLPQSVSWSPYRSLAGQTLAGQTLVGRTFRV
ncbi:MAG: hypothetical protein ACRDTT_01715, partial [Pseudonocardiaceae bacterium]